jgi:hypothetical protein
MQAIYTLVQVFITSFVMGSVTIFLGIDNGDLRVYDLSSFKVLKAVKGNGKMISAIVCMKRPGTEFRDAWITSGKQVCMQRLFHRHKNTSLKRV